MSIVFHGNNDNKILYNDDSPTEIASRVRSRGKIETVLVWFVIFLGGLYIRLLNISDRKYVNIHNTLAKKKDNQLKVHQHCPIYMPSKLASPRNCVLT